MLFRSEDEIDLNYEIDESIDSYQKSVQAADLVEEILELDETLKQYNITFEELEYYSPQHRDTRKTLNAMAIAFVQDKECLDVFINKKRLPVTLFVGRTGFSPKIIERYRKYLITLILVRLNPQWVQLSGFIQGPILTGKEGSA